MTELQSLRQQLKRARQTIPADERADAESAIIGRILRFPRFCHARRVAAYFASGGEVDPMPLLYESHTLRKHCYLPVLHPFSAGRLWFCHWHPESRLIVNRYDIPEPNPHHRRLVAAQWLDLVIVPLLGFDPGCHRLGMGGGYYDRTFAFVNRRQRARRPFLLGVAFETQRVDTLPHQPWDIPLDAVCTERNLYRR